MYRRLARQHRELRIRGVAGRSVAGRADRGLSGASGIGANAIRAPVQHLQSSRIPTSKPKILGFLLSCA